MICSKGTADNVLSTPNSVLLLKRCVGMSVPAGGAVVSKMCAGAFGCRCRVPLLERCVGCCC